MIDDNIKILAKKIADEHPTPYQISVWINESIKTQSNYVEYRVVTNPFDAPVPIDEGLRLINEFLQWKIDRIGEIATCDCECCQQIKEVLKPILIG